MDKVPATTKIFLAQIMKFIDFPPTFFVFKNSNQFAKFPDLKEKSNFPDQWPPNF